ncbi:hypothetical protein BC827DRAFT_1302987 [Russula dissimulans]|nr:hypothetical protein BC827DRAFT_1302987 [Russula dissimulans]
MSARHRPVPTGTPVAVSMINGVLSSESDDNGFLLPNKSPDPSKRRDMNDAIANKISQSGSRLGLTSAKELTKLQTRLLKREFDLTQPKHVGNPPSRHSPLWTRQAGTGESSGEEKVIIPEASCGRMREDRHNLPKTIMLVVPSLQSPSRVRLSRVNDLNPAKNRISIIYGAGGEGILAPGRFLVRVSTAKAQIIGPSKLLGERDLITHFTAELDVATTAQLEKTYTSQIPIWELGGDCVPSYPWGTEGRAELAAGGELERDDADLTAHVFDASQCQCYKTNKLYIRIQGTAHAKRFTRQTLDDGRATHGHLLLFEHAEIFISALSSPGTHFPFPDLSEWVWVMRVSTVCIIDHVIEATTKNCQWIALVLAWLNPFLSDAKHNFGRPSLACAQLIPPPHWAGWSPCQAGRDPRRRVEHVPTPHRRRHDSRALKDTVFLALMIAAERWNALTDVLPPVAPGAETSRGTSE